MKIYLSFLLLLVSFIAFGQKTIQNPCPVDPSTKLITYTNTKEVAGASKKELYDKAKAWCNKNYSQFQWVMDYSTSDQSQIVGIPFMVFDPPMANKIYMQYVLNIYFKEGTYRYDISNLQFIRGNFKIQHNKIKPKQLRPAEELFDPERIVFSSLSTEKHMRQNLDLQVKALIADLENSMQKQVW